MYQHYATSYAVVMVIALPRPPRTGVTTIYAPMTASLFHFAQLTLVLHCMFMISVKDFALSIQYSLYKIDHQTFILCFED